MTDKELRHMSRERILEMLISSRKENAMLTERLNDAERHAEEMQHKLDEHRIAIQESGSIAEAALRLNGVFTSAERAAAQYIENVKLACEEKLEAIRKQEAETARKCEEMERTTAAYCEEMKRNAESSDARKWDEVRQKLDQLADENAELRRQIPKQQEKRKWLI